MKKTLEVCDYPSCRKIADGKCAFCQKDYCETHFTHRLQISVALAPALIPQGNTWMKPEPEPQNSVIEQAERLYVCTMCRGSIGTLFKDTTSPRAPNGAPSLLGQVTLIPQGQSPDTFTSPQHAPLKALLVNALSEAHSYLNSLNAANRLGGWEAVQKAVKGEEK